MSARSRRSSRANGSRANGNGSAASRSRSHQRVRYAVVGLGHIAQVAVLPAFAHARRNSELMALVSDNSEKLKAMQRRYRVPLCADYEGYDALLASGDIDAVYIALPNAQHREFTERAAAQKVHVLCEKPLAASSADCEAMVRAAREHGVKLMTAYRLHFEAANLAAVRIASSGRLGTLRLFLSGFCMQVRPANIRLDRELGGGPLFDIGIYCINAARYLFRAEPAEVFAASASAQGDERFAEVPEMVSATLRFPDERLAQFTCSFGAADASWYELLGAGGRLRLDPAYEYAEPLQMQVWSKRGESRRTFPKRDQFAPELLHFSTCILQDKEPAPSGVEGWIDVAIIEALRRSMQRGTPEPVSVPEPEHRPEPEQALNKPAVRKPALVKVAPAST